MRELFLKVLAFFLCIKHESPKELSLSGKKLRQNMLIESLRLSIPRDNIESIWLIGAIEYSEDKLDEVKIILHQGMKYDFKVPQNFNFKLDYIDFYQITTKDNRCFIYAVSNTYALSQEDKKMMLVQIHEQYPTENLKATMRYV